MPESPWIINDLRNVRILTFWNVVYIMYTTDPKSKNKFVKTVAFSRAQEDILKAVNPQLLPKCSV